MTDRSTVRAVVNYLGAIALLGLAGIVVLVWRGVDAQAIAVVGTITGGAAGSLGTLLASTRTTPNDAEVAQALAPFADQAQPLAVKVNQPPNEPVPTTDVAPGADTDKTSRRRR